MALQNKNTFQKSGTCRKNLEVRQDCNLFIIIIIIITIIIILHRVIWSDENNMTLGESRLLFVLFCDARFREMKTKDSQPCSLPLMYHFSLQSVEGGLIRA